MKRLVFFYSVLLTTTCFSSPPDSLDIKIGQMILTGYPGTEVDPQVLEEIRSGKAGSILLFEKNVPRTSKAFAPLKKVLWTYQRAAPIPLLITIDQEGGRVNRLKEKYGFPRSITADAAGKSPSLDSVRFYAESISSNLAGLGINVNFAPVVDVAVNPDNPVIVKPGRSFSSKSDSVTLMATEYIKAHRKFGIITVLKHFPGHGSSMDDSHYGVADVTKSWTADELKPYQALLDSGYVDAIMSAHIVNKNLDPSGYPGTLSSRMLDSLLRKKLKYDGVVFSDDMQMHAISKQYGLEESVKRAINAGIDIICFSNNIQDTEERTVAKVHAMIRRMVISGEIKQQRIDESFRRIMKLKSRLTENRSDFYRKVAALEKTRANEARKELDEIRNIPVETGKKKKGRRRS